MRSRPLAAAVLAAFILTSATAATAVSRALEPSLAAPTPRPVAWEWPVTDPRIVRPYAAPPTRFGAGHRGIDLAIGRHGSVHAPADGVVAFSASVAGRGVVTIDHGGGYVSTFEPVEEALLPGTVVQAGEAVARASSGGHSAAGTVHLGVRLHGEYINPMLMWGAIPRAVLLPCC